MKFCHSLLETKVPEGYCSNFRNLISTNDCQLQGLKSHDYHTLMQQLLPLAIRDCLPKNVRKAVIRMCFHFNSLCSKVLDKKSLDKLEKDHFVTMCLFEQYFLPAFFDIMVHLMVILLTKSDYMDRFTFVGCIHLRET